MAKKKAAKKKAKKKVSKKTSSAGQPEKVFLRSYQVGFGDCLLLSFSYAGGGSRHMLIDFGSMAKPAHVPKDQFARIAADIAARCGQEPIVVVATHRHQDHVSGFATKDDGSGSGNVIAALNVQLVLQPWTEDPSADPDATVPTASLTGSQALTRALASMHEVAARTAAAARDRSIGAQTLREIAFIGDDNLSNRSAVTNLASMAENRYLSFGVDPETQDALPGVQIDVLGPPTLEQTDTILTQRRKDEAEFWHLEANAQGTTEGGAPGPIFPDAKTLKSTPPDRRWFERKLNRTHGAQLLSIVRALDDAMNNTSLILLIRVGELRLLFPGDAQIENWQYALEHEDPEVRERIHAELAKVNVYKVGHHGSLNATPKTLWGLFENRSKTVSPTRLQSVMSTMSGEHGNANRGTEVPRKKLTSALKNETEHFSTTQLRKKTDLYKDFEFEV